jgi:hypothetical protein
VSDSFPATLECLFNVPVSVEEDDLRTAVGQLAETLKADLIAVGAPVEVVMEAAAAINQFAKHMQASRKPYGFPELGGYMDPGSERAALSSLNSALTALTGAMVRLRVVRANPEQLQAALAERDHKFIRCVQALLQKAVTQEEAVSGTDLQFWLQSELFPLMQSEGLVE